jgi:Tfp pilus assembly protein PilF
LGDLWLASGRAGEAEVRLNQALSLDPNLTPARLQLADLLSVQCRTREAAAQRYYLLRRKGLA